MIYYFTGTGNSLWAARELAEQLGEQMDDLANFEDKPLVCEDEVIGFVCPTYMASLPWFVKKVLLDASLNSDAYIFLVVTSNTGDGRFSSKSMDSLLVRNGATLAACFDLQMPGNCIESSAQENEERLLAAPATVAEIAERVAAKARNHTSSGEAAKDDVVEKSSFYGKKRSLFRMAAFTFDVTSDCNGCGICADICPVQSISIQDGKAVHSGLCAACLACFHWCPKHATLLTSRMLRGRSQYHHPEVTLSDIENGREHQS